MKHTTTIHDISVGGDSINTLEKSLDGYFLSKKNLPFHIITLNPEIYVLAYQNNEYKNIINTAEAVLIDGVGIQLLGRKNGLNLTERVTGIDLVWKLCAYAIHNGLKVFFLGGKGISGKQTGEAIKKKFPTLRYLSDEGAIDIRTQSSDENATILKKINDFKPDFLFVAYGPPYQEKWIYDNRKELRGIVCVGVGGAFKIISGEVPRAPRILTEHGLEWIWRSLTEPQRILTKAPRYLTFLSLLFSSAKKPQS